MINCVGNIPEVFPLKVLRGESICHWPQVPDSGFAGNRSSVSRELGWTGTRLGFIFPCLLPTRVVFGDMAGDITAGDDGVPRTGRVQREGGGTKSLLFTKSLVSGTLKRQDQKNVTKVGTKGILTYTTHCDFGH